VRILFLSPWFPYPLDNGSKIRIYHLLKALSSRHEVALLSFVRDGERADPRGLDGLCCSVQTAPWREFAPRRARALIGFLSPLPRSVVDTYSPEMQSLVGASVQRGRPDVIVASQAGMARYATAVAGIRRIFDEVELGAIHDAWANAPTRFSRWRRGLTWAKVRRYAGRTARAFDACTVVSERERALLREAAPDYGAVHVVPNGVDLDALRPGLAEPQPNTLVYNGALTYSANYDAMRHFLEAILPLIRLQSPEVTLRITGSTQGVDVAALPVSDGVMLTGYLPDIRPAVAGAWACVVPLRAGGGTRVKILEAMAVGTPVIATTKGAEGLDVRPGEDILVADDPADFAAQTVRLLRDSDLRRRLSRSGRALVEARYGWNAIGQQFAQIVECVVEAQR
jgi:sugar transferase (PEP-CTERM/EpsH1 system associated)